MSDGAVQASTEDVAVYRRIQGESRAIKFIAGKPGQGGGGAIGHPPLHAVTVAERVSRGAYRGGRAQENPEAQQR